MATDFSQTPAKLVHHTLERSGVTLHYWLAGREDAPLLAFLHGALMDHRMFNAQVSAFVGAYRVLVWDSRGHGKSRPIKDAFLMEDCAGDFAAILDAIGTAQAIICGQSMGGYIAQQIYLRHPARVRALAMIGSTDITQPYARWLIWSLKLTYWMFKIWPYRNFAQVTANSTAISEPARNYALESVLALGREGMLPIWKAVTLAINAQGVPAHTIDVPLLLTHGIDDGTGTIRFNMPKWAARASTKLHIIPDAGHNANQDNPEAFNEILREFLKAL